MIIVNFAHPITNEQREQIEALAGRAIQEIRDVPVQFDNTQPFQDQLNSFLNRVPVTAVEWQAEDLLINPPSLSSIALLLVADLHGRMGHFPAVLRLKPRTGPLPGYEAVEIINLQAVRDTARGMRNS